MDVTLAGALVIGGLCLLLLVGTPVAFALGGVSIAAIILTQGVSGLNYFAQTFYHRMTEFSLVAIPLFIVMGSAVATTPISRDLYSVLDRGLKRIPGGLAIANIGACGIFAALSGSSAATCAAIGKMGIPEMLARRYPEKVAAGSIAAGGTLGILIPPSITMIIYGIATETSIGRLFFAGLVPGLVLIILFAAWTMVRSRRMASASPQQRQNGYGTTTLGTTTVSPIADNATTRDFTSENTADNATFVRVLPFLGLIAAILYVLYGGIATPSEAAGVEPSYASCSPSSSIVFGSLERWPESSGSRCAKAS